ncbi:MAG: hypothetical protein FJ225_11265 [Lentisphaerae bacterium]|nr:hypothetical protein [Lentisphaerota bacterium]
MDEQKREGLTTAPEKLMRNFTASRFLLWIGAAVALHVVFIGLFSLGYIRDTWIDPEGAALRKAEAEAAAKAELQRQKAPPPAPAAGQAKGGTNETVAPATKPAPVVTNEEALLEARRNTPVVRAITEAPKPGEIPSQPGDSGIDINDTNVK